MNWIQRLFKKKKVEQPMNSALNKHNVIGSVCPNCNAKGYRTTVSSTSYACKKCLTWWAN